MSSDGRNPGDENGDTGKDLVGSPKHNLTPAEGDAETVFAALRAVAREQDEDSSGIQVEPVSPLSSADKERIVAASLAYLVAQGGTPGAPAPVTLLPAARFRRGPVWTAVLVSLAAAAGLVFLLRPVPERTLAPLPDYEVSASGGFKEKRGADPVLPDHPRPQAVSQRVGRATELLIVARPATAVAGEVSARVFLVRSATAKEVAVRPQIAATGAVELRVRPSDEAAGGGGPASLLIVVGRPAAVRAITSSAVAADRRERGDVRWLTVPLEMAGD